MKEKDKPVHLSHIAKSLNQNAQQEEAQPVSQPETFPLPTSEECSCTPLYILRKTNERINIKFRPKRISCYVPPVTLKQLLLYVQKES